MQMLAPFCRSEADRAWGVRVAAEGCGVIAREGDLGMGGGGGTWKAVHVTSTWMGGERVAAAWEGGGGM